MFWLVPDLSWCFSGQMKRLSFGTMSEGIDETNFIGRLNNYCQSKKLSHDFILEKKCGPSHNPQWVWLTGDMTGARISFVMCETKIFNLFLYRFTYRVVINKKPFPAGEGKNVKEAKQMAAMLALSALEKQSAVVNIFCILTWFWTVRYTHTPFSLWNALL